MSIYVKVQHHKAEGFNTYTTFIFNTILFCYKLSSFAFIFLTPVYRQDIDKSANTVMFLSFRTDRSGQTVQTQIRLSDQGLHCLPFRLHRLDSLLYGRAT